MATLDTATDEEDDGLLPNETGLTPEPGKSFSARDAIVRKLLDIVVLPAAHLTANERSLVADLMLQLLDKVDETLRLEVARRIARVTEAPSSLLRVLLLSEPTVAEPIIRRTEPVPEALLIECARKGKTIHRELMARRLDLTTSLADVILEFREPEVAKLLLRRDEFTFSPTAIDLLVSLSTADHDMQALLLRRRELEPAHGFMMFWWVSSENRKRILTRFALDRTIIQDSVQELYPLVFRGPGADPLVKEMLIMLDRRHRPRGINGEPVSMEVAIKTMIAARKYPAQEIIMATGMIAGVSRELVARILRDPTVEPFAVMCKSLGIPRAEFYNILMQKAGENPLTPERAEEILGVFDMMARDFARAVLRYWDWDGNPRIAHITRLLGLADEDQLTL
ncbi:MAG: DUF2336 domain-containing protein [Parvularculaceae bacterium]|nr:DUF2336 domain-containing protein [Parvularculaceae bacterium]